MTIRKNFAAIISFAAIATLSTASYAAGQSALADCYDLVIDSCNQTNHPVPCAESGMDECDEEYGNQVFDLPPNFRAPGKTRSFGLVAS